MPKPAPPAACRKPLMAVGDLLLSGLGVRIDADTYALVNNHWCVVRTEHTPNRLTEED